MSGTTHSVPPPDAAGRIRRNLETVRGRIGAACRRAGRRPDEVTLVAVTKTRPPWAVRALYDAGARDFGENRVDAGLAQMDAASDACPEARWHLIGHLQRNKAARALAGGFRKLHGVESARLLAALAAGLEKLGGVADIWLEVNVAGETTKYGVSPDHLPALLEAALTQPALRVRGLMAMAPLADDPEDARPVFAALRTLRDANARRFGPPLPDLSMGMSGDYEVAVEEGATLVRVGTALFA